MDVLFGGEIFMQVESAGHLEDVLPSVVLRFRGLKQCHKGTVGTQCRRGGKKEGVLVSGWYGIVHWYFHWFQMRVSAS
jgi:hypothetical protein